MNWNNKVKTVKVILFETQKSLVYYNNIVVRVDGRKVLPFIYDKILRSIGNNVYPMVLYCTLYHEYIVSYIHSYVLYIGTRQSD